MYVGPLEAWHLIPAIPEILHSLLRHLHYVSFWALFQLYPRSFTVCFSISTSSPFEPPVPSLSFGIYRFSSRLRCLLLFLMSPNSAICPMSRWAFPMLCCHQETRRSLPHPVSPWVSPSLFLLPWLCRSSLRFLGLFPLVLFQPGAPRNTLHVSLGFPLVPFAVRVVPTFFTCWDISPRFLSARGPGNLLHVSLPLTLLAPCV